MKRPAPSRNGQTQTSPPQPGEEAIFREQARLLDMIVRGEPAQRCLDELCRGVERIEPAVRAIILLSNDALPPALRTPSPFSDAVSRRAAIFSRSRLDAPITLRAGSPQSHQPDDHAEWRDEWASLCSECDVDNGCAETIFDVAGRPLGVVLLRTDTDEDLAPSCLALARLAATVVSIVLLREESARSVRDTYGAYRQILEAIPAALYTTDSQGRVTTFNSAAVALWGRRPEPGELWCGSLRMFEPDGETPIDRENCPMAIALREQRPVHGGRVVVESPDGARRTIIPHPTPLFDASGTLVGGVNLLLDITERAKAEEALRRSEERYREIVENHSEMICRFRPDGEIIFVNGAYARLTSSSLQDLIGSSFWRFIPEEEHDGIRDLLARISPDAPEVHIENRFFDANGVPRWTLWTNRGLAFDAQGRATELQSAGIDITARKAAESALRESETRFRTMADAAPALIWMSAPDGRRTWFNQRWLEFTGRSIDRELGEGWTQGIYPEDLDRCQSTLAGAFEHRRRCALEYRLRRHDGRYRWILDHAVPLHDAEGRFTGFIGSCIDIHDRRNAEAALQQSHDNLRAQRDELDRFNRAAVGRELRMIDLKREINALRARLGEPEPYALDFEQSDAVLAAHARGAAPAGEESHDSHR